MVSVFATVYLTLGSSDELLEAARQVVLESRMLFYLKEIGERG